MSYAVGVVPLAVLLIPTAAVSDGMTELAGFVVWSKPAIKYLSRII